ncbi:hypothetical protein CTAYLR_004160 [Chrysophaeum taylorii]|uniref:Uncharacterized protein n=1 Tax=Chrysophaeum taylorii TaxID=2483200 RepID=A0AAD7XQI3_9STRA|nr:hypothetical protein CTAYLR_004160 [Chrysophaeum taylorii]
MATPAPTFSPTESDDDDNFTLNEDLANLEWSDIWNILVPSLFAAMVMMGFVQWQRRKRSNFHLVYCPRYRWERVMASKSAGYAPLDRPKRLGASVLDWLLLATRIGDPELLRHVGLEMYVMLRFIRLCCKMCLFGTLVVAPVCVGVYGTADTRSSTSEYSRVAWYRFTLANVDEHNAGRLWTPAIMLWVVTIHTMVVVGAECLAYVELKQNFFSTAPPASDPIVAEQQLRSVMIERLPPKLRSSERLYQHWNALLPGRVHSATVCVDTRAIINLVAEREDAALEVERLALREQRTGEEPLVGRTQKDLVCCGLCEVPSFCLSEDRRAARGTPAIDFARARLDKLNATFKAERESVVEANEALRASEERAARETEAKFEREQADDGVSIFSRLAALLTGRGSARDARKALRESGLAEAALGTTNAVASAAQLAKRVTVGDRFCDTGFVTFKDYTSANMVRQMQLSERPHMEAAFGGVPDAREIIWANISESLDAQRARENTGSAMVYVLAFYWSFYIALCYVIASYKTLKEFGILPSLTSMPSSERTVVRYLLSVAPVGLISLALALFPIILENLAEHYEHRKLRSLVQLSVFERNFFLQIINLWLTVVAGSVWDALKEIIRHPSKFFKFIGKTLPAVSVYFVELVVIKTFLSLFWEYARVFPWLRLRAAKLAAGGALTARDHRDKRYLSPEMPYGSTYSTLLMVLVFALLFAVIAPLVYLFVLIYFVAALVVYTHQALHVYIPVYEGGGIFFFPVYTYLINTLIATQITVFGFLLVKKAWWQAALTFFLPVATYCFKGHVQHEFVPPCDKPSLQLLLEQDANLARAADPGRPSLDALVARFDENLYRQPELDETDVAPLAAPNTTRPMREEDDDADYDDLGDSESKHPTTSAASGSLQAPLVTEEPNGSYATFSPFVVSSSPL